MTPEEVASVLVEHGAHVAIPDGCAVRSIPDDGRPRCLTYRLAETLAAERAKVAQIAALAELDTDDVWRKKDSRITRLTERREGYTVTASYVRVDDIRRILADPEPAASGG